VYEDKAITCVDCGAEFIFTAGEQEFHASRGFTTPPKRCADCRRARKGEGPQRPARQLFEAVCASCGNIARLPFEPRGDRPVYCSDCFQPTPRAERSSFHR
jgi:CxxC-x17-CxxC domain-containing protein